MEASLKRRGTDLLWLAALLLVDIAFVDPALHADDAVSGVRLGESIVDVCAQRVQRQTTLEVPLRTGDFIAVQAARYANLDSLAAKAQGGVNRLAHGATESNPLLQLQSDILAHQLRIQLRLVHLENVNEDIAVGAFLQLALKLLDLGALPADYDAGTRCANDQAQLVARALHFHRADTGGLELLFQLATQVNIFDEQLVVVPLNKPA